MLRKEKWQRPPRAPQPHRCPRPCAKYRRRLIGMTCLSAASRHAPGLYAVRAVVSTSDLCVGATSLQSVEKQLVPAMPATDLRAISIGELTAGGRPGGSKRP
ncbi:hypothetical protein CC85DRAFT_130881 [Cutaneotrichosporon oleaginosum]|uniref:Uncharacterized protein n=1 Tax=Cutaneotrichosporon oleaginosum TaxID=879819 RepID=A0A0J0XIT3_9TREE|nr:uncharacterized protein CC85DRAFT_130881 [Cutaneotrichosporon oleaginosum]KLT40967.1 hypothetical protein CC85DRAFT_130881 [Cutaneotrichosporon oleaginosum]TXT06237.1 hypothetical protein COLE_05568 [Cutaneotrichosporon oleaginosum]